MRTSTTTIRCVSRFAHRRAGRSLAWAAVGTLFIGLIGGCGSDRALDASSTNADWNLVRFHDEDVDGDLVVDPIGSLWLQDSRGGGESSARGLLAGERLETLVRLIGDLPLHSYSPGTTCETGRFFVSVTRDGNVTTYASDACDTKAPSSIGELRNLLSTVAAEFRANRVDAVDFKVLSRGTYSSFGEESNRVVYNRDEFIRLLQDIDGRRPAVVPQVDFSQDIVIAHFLGERPTGGFEVSPETAERTENDWTRVSFVEEVPGPRCVVTEATTRPYVILALERPDKGLLFESSTRLIRCE